MSTLEYYEQVVAEHETGDAFKTWIGQGVSAFVVGDSPLRDLTKSREGWENNYHGKSVAQLFCDSFVEFVKANHTNPDLRAELARSGVLYANEMIREFNINKGYVYPPGEEYDIPECVGFAAVAIDGMLYYAGLEDCYVNLLQREQKNGEISYPDRIPLAYTLGKTLKWSKSIIEQASQDPSILESYMTKEQIERFGKINLLEALRSLYQRNNPDAGDAGWGAFNGDERVVQFIQYGAEEIMTGDRLLLITDGMLPFFNTDEILDFIDSLVGQGETLNAESLIEKLKIYFQAKIDSGAKSKERTMLYTFLSPQNEA